MNNTREVGWGRFLKGFPWYNEERKYPLQAYSEFMPPVRTGINPVTEAFIHGLSGTMTFSAGRFWRLKKNTS